MLGQWNDTFAKLKKWPEPIYMRVGYVFEWRFSAGMIFTIFQGRPGGIAEYQYTRKKFAKIPKNTQNSSKYTQNYTQVYFIPEIQRK